MLDSDYQEFPCDLCGNTEAIEVPHSREYQNNEPIHICQCCGFVYVKRRRSAQRIADVWSQDIFGEGYSAAIPAVKARLTFVAEFIHQNIGLQNKQVCEIGAGEGQFLKTIRQPPYEAIVFGVEPSENNCEILEKLDIPHFNGTIEAYSSDRGNTVAKFDIVAILWTLENCQDCRAMLAAAYQILNPGGFVIVATGSRILVPFKKPLYLYLSKNPADTHVSRFSANTLQGILAVSGFKVTHLNRYIDSNILCAIAKKVGGKETVSWEKDNYLDVYNFFERWHTETKIYYS